MSDEGKSLQNVVFQSNGGQAHGYLSVPQGGSGRGIVVIQEWWGLTDHIARIADRLAGGGFVALAPDLFGGRTTHDAEEAGKMMQELPVDDAIRDLRGAVDYLLSHESVTGTRVGAIGFCMGGAFVLGLAAADGDRVAAAVAFYPTVQERPDYHGLSAAVQAHFGEQDEFVKSEQVGWVREAVKEATGSEPDVRLYPAGHAFNNEDNLLGTYDPEQAAKAWDEAVEFLKSYLA